MTAGSEEEDITSGYTLESSDKAVFTVNNNTITAQGPGTATLTIKYGGMTTTQTITVENEKREMAEVELAKPNLKVGKDPVADTKEYTSTNMVIQCLKMLRLRFQTKTLHK